MRGLAEEKAEAVGVGHAPEVELDGAAHKRGGDATVGGAP